MADSDSQQSAETNALETEKRRLEMRLLQRQLSAHGVVISWLQATAVPVALLGAILAFFVGFGQLRQGADNQSNERFDKVLTRLSSGRPDERMTAVAGLSLFLRGNTELLQTQALVFLVNALSLETDERVQGAILDVLADLPRGGRPSQVALNEGLRAAIARNRSLTRSTRDNWPKRILEQKKQRLAQFKIAGLSLVAVDETIPAKALAALSTKQYLSLLDAEQGPFQMLDPATRVPLKGLSRAITTLLSHGATSDSLEGIYCEDCDFSSAKSLDQAIFDNAFLVNADFGHVSLRHASFTNADIGGTSFFDSDLTGANLRVDPESRRLTGKKYNVLLPEFECAKLGGADLSGQPLVLFAKQFTTYYTSPHYEIQLPQMTSVQLDGSTKLDKFSIIVATIMTDDYVNAYKASREVQRLTNPESPSMENWLSEYKGTLSDIREIEGGFLRVRGTFAKEDSKYSSTHYFLQWEFTSNNLKNLAKDAFILRGHVDQPALRALPLYSQFVDAVSAQSVPKGTIGNLAQQRSDEAAQIWAGLKKSVSCSGKSPKPSYSTTIPDPY